MAYTSVRKNDLGLVNVVILELGYTGLPTPRPTNGIKKCQSQQDVLEPMAVSSLTCQECALSI